MAKNEKTTGFIDLLYTNSVGFLRDVFQYAIPGMLLIVLLSLPAVLKNKTEIIAMILHLKDALIWIFAAILVLSYIGGQITYSFSLLLSKDIASLDIASISKRMKKTEVYRNKLYVFLSDEIYSKVKNKYDEFTSRTSTRYEDSNDKKNGENNDKDIHLYYEISTFVNNPEVHGKFIERYNILKHYKQNMSSVFILSSIGYMILYNLCLSFLPLCSFIVAEILFTGLSYFLYCDYIRTEEGFLKRVFWSYYITKGNS